MLTRQQKAHAGITFLQSKNNDIRRICNVWGISGRDEDVNYYIPEMDKATVAFMFECIDHSLNYSFMGPPPGQAPLPPL